MATDPRAREILELVSRAVEANPGADARTLRVRARVKRLIGDEALELLERAGFIERRRVSFAATHAVGQGGDA